LNDWQQRGVRVDSPAPVGVDERLGEDRAEAGDGDEVDVVAFEHVDDVVRIGHPVEVGPEVGPLHELARDAVLPGQSQELRRVGRQLPQRSEALAGVAH